MIDGGSRCCFRCICGEKAGDLRSKSFSWGPRRPLGFLWNPNGQGRSLSPDLRGRELPLVSRSAGLSEVGQSSNLAVKLIP